jgi:predicted permease
MRRLAWSGALLIVSFVLGFGGIALFISREELGGPDLFNWERGLLMAGYVTAALGMVALAAGLQRVRWVVLTRVATVTFVLAAILAVAAETSLVTQGFSFNPDLATVMIVSLFVAEAMIGAVLLDSARVPRWVAWTMILWNVLWLLGLLIFASSDKYFPGLHFIPLLLIGIPLVRRRPQTKFEPNETPGGCPSATPGVSVHPKDA